MGVIISKNPRELLSSNILSYKNTLKNTLQRWKNLAFSWWGRLALVKNESSTWTVIFAAKLDQLLNSSRSFKG